MVKLVALLITLFSLLASREGRLATGPPATRLVLQSAPWSVVLRRRIA
jgi:hypothetical protein